MSDEEIKKMLIELREKRKSNPKAMISSASYNPDHNKNNIRVVSMDFASLYQTQQNWWNITPIPEKVIIRKTRIKRLFQ